eukprot:gene8860-3745_t
MALSMNVSRLSTRGAVAPRRTLTAFPSTQMRRASVVVQAEVQKCTAAELDDIIAARTTPIIVDFYATWCGPCLLLATELEKIEGLPTIVFISMDSSKPALRTEGLIGSEQIKDILKEL